MKKPWTGSVLTTDWSVRGRIRTLKRRPTQPRSRRRTPLAPRHGPSLIDSSRAACTCYRSHPASPGEPDEGVDDLRIVSPRGERIAERQNWTLLELFWVLWLVIWVWLLKPLWRAALQLTTLSKKAFEALYWTSPAEGNVRCAQASLLGGEGMMTPSTSSEQTAAPATPSTFDAPRSHAMHSEATPAAA